MGKDSSYYAPTEGGQPYKGGGGGGFHQKWCLPWWWAALSGLLLRLVTAVTASVAWRSPALLPGLLPLSPAPS